MEKKHVYIGIFAIAILICILSPFLASDNPDGLEASAEQLNPDALESEQVINPILPDYSIEGMEDNPIAGVASLIIGAVLVVAVAFGIFKVITKKN